MSTRKICVVTGTRAEYGLLRWVIDGIAESPSLDLQLFVTGMHLSPEFGLTYRDIVADGYTIDRKIEMLLSSDTAVGISKSMALGVSGFADAFSDLQPDLVLVLGDRYEIFAACSAAMIAQIPIAHLHGGEATEGLIDEPIRHSITKMAHLHFVAADEYKNRVIQLGESPDRVFNVGGLGIDNINRLNLFTKSELEKSLGFDFGARNLLITFHPVTLEQGTSEHQIKNLLGSLSALNETTLIFTMPNADTDGRIIFRLIENFIAKTTDAYIFTSLGQLRYLSCLQYVDGVIGNSSSGLCEVPSFRKGTVNIGDRQRGRLKAKSVIDCEPDKDAISDAIDLLYSQGFQDRLQDVANPYGMGGASESVIKTLTEVSFEGILKKKFYDLAVS